MLGFLKTTLIGGVGFLIPIVVLVAIIGKALEIMNRLAAPLAERLPVDSVAGLAVVQLLSILILLLICFAAGLAAKTSTAKRLVRALEANVLDNIPAYALLKAKTQGALGPEDAEGMRPVSARFDDSWQLAFEIERLEEGKTVIFLPGAPDPWAGSVCVVTEDRITPLDLTVRSAADLMKRLGQGATEAWEDLQESQTEVPKP